MASVVVIAAIGVGCSALGIGKLDANSTCKDFLEARPQAQNEVIIDLVMSKEGGRRNPLREGNAAMQFSFVCDSNANRRLGDIAI